MSLSLTRAVSDDYFEVRQGVCFEGQKENEEVTSCECTSGGTVLWVGNHQRLKLVLRTVSPVLRNALLAGLRGKLGVWTTAIFI